MRKRKKKIITAGPLVIEAIYPVASGNDASPARRAKQKMSTAAQMRLNRRHSYEKLELGLAANFQPGDIVACVTYDDKHLPGTREEAEARFKYFRAKVVKAWRAKGVEPVIFWSTEHKHGEGRWHHHVVITAADGDDYRLIRELWGYGEDIDLRPLRLDAKKNYASLARYMTKEGPDKMGQHQWHATRNAAKPVVETSWVDSSESIQVPRGAFGVEWAGESNAYGTWQWCRYLLPTAVTVKHAKRRKRQC